MKPVLLSIFLLIAVKSSYAQQISLPELFSIVESSEIKMDTLLKKRGYRLMQKESDSGASLLYYTNLERTEKGPAWVRSITLKKVDLPGMSSRLITYRTYRKKEYLDLLQWLLQNNFQTKKKESFGLYIHTIYENGSWSVLVKQEKQRLPSGVQVWSYEFETGK